MNFVVLQQHSGERAKICERASPTWTTVALTSPLHQQRAQLIKQLVSEIDSSAGRS